MKRRFALSLLGSLVAVVAAAIGTTTASAHGERAQESFIRMESVAFWDVKFSTNNVKQGEDLTITGTAKLLETWPSNLSGGNPSVCYFTVVEPGAQFVLKDRVINGAQAPQSVFCHKGGTYDFSMTLTGRSPGNWHVHPAVAVREAGTIIGPGTWITVNEAPGGFSYPIKLLNGQTVDLESYGQWLIVGFSVATFVLGMAWMIMWTWTRPTITRLAVTNQLPLNQDGGDAVGLITRQDHRNTAIIAGATVVLVGAGFLISAFAFPGRIPQQTDWITPPTSEQPASIGEASLTGAVWDPSSQSLTMTAQIKNTGKSQLTLTAFRTSYLTFVNTTARSPESGEYQMTATPAGTIDPGQTQTVQIKLPGSVFQQEELLPIGKAQMEVAGVLELTDALGTRNMDTVLTSLMPTST
ncbi:MAG TPA: methane monooxygenase/ammonia monooxygenase subunit B [Candidatus Dormibacteraeota bacterium]|nr:methane monooxygenase/ammonia monooxygenase subunit B [Candidatus Dormibacteraeota bacterium]